jgi:hypothetical protein
MFSTTGKCYSTGEIRDMMIEAGFINIRYLPTTGNRSIMIGEKSA